MRKAQRLQRLERSKKKVWIYKLLTILIIPVVLILAFVFLKISTKYWNGKDKFVYAYRMTSGDIAISVNDPTLMEETTLIIPGDTQVDVARSYGTFRIKNVWQLSMNEHLGGSLIAGTLTKDFLFPVFLWADSDSESLKNSDFPGIFKFIFSPSKTNIPFGDRFWSGMFALQVKSIDKTEINLGTSKFLQKATLNDGMPGYILNGQVSGRLTSYFSDNDFSDGNIKVGIIDSTGVFGVADTVGEVIQVLGGKVVSIDKQPMATNTDCVANGKDPKIVTKVMNLLGCKKSGEKTSFELEIDLGNNFAKRF